MLNEHDNAKITPEEFLAWAAGQEQRHDKTLPSLDYILFVNTERRSVQSFWRGTDGLWQDALVDGLDARIKLEKLNISFSLRDIYDEIKFRPKPKLVMPEDDEPTSGFSPT